MVGNTHDVLAGGYRMHVLAGPSLAREPGEDPACRRFVTHCDHM